MSLEEKQMAEPCPNCGYCPTCGRARVQTWPVYPYPYVPVPTYAPKYTGPFWWANGVTMKTLEVQSGMTSMAVN